MTTRLLLISLLAAAVFLTGPTSAQDGVRLPDIGDSSGAVVSRQEEDAYGKALMREFRRLAIVVDDPLVEEYVRHLGYSLVAYSDEPERQFNFLVVDDDNVNAFAAPGGFIGVHSELLLTADSESEVAAVLAHEVAHVTQRHLARAIENQQKVSLPMTLLMLGAVLAGASSGSGDAVQSAVVGSQALMAQLRINFTRANEHEADRLGIQTLAAAGYDPDGMPSFFGKMSRIARNYPEVPEFLRTHPVESTRIAEAKNRAAQVHVARPAAKRDPGYFLLMRERTRVLTADRPADAIAYYQRLGADELHEAYGAALAHLRSGDAVGAAEIIQPWRESASGSVPLALLLAELEFVAGNGDQQYQHLVAAYPNHRAVAGSYAEALLKRGGPGDAARAEELLRPLLARRTDDPSLFLLYSRAADRAGESVRASEAYAQHVFLQGRVYDAVTQLRNLLKTPGLNYYERSRIEARLSEMEPILAEIQRENGWDPSEGKGRSGLRRSG